MAAPQDLDIAVWLASVHLEQYADAFRQQGLATAGAARGLGHGELRQGRGAQKGSVCQGQGWNPSVRSGTQAGPPDQPPCTPPSRPHLHALVLLQSRLLPCPGASCLPFSDRWTTGYRPGCSPPCGLAHLVGREKLEPLSPAPSGSPIVRSGHRSCSATCLWQIHLGTTVCTC